MSKELIKKLAEWAGLKDAQIDDLGHPIYRKIVEGKDYGWVRIPKFTDSLDACFKWLVPKVYDMELLKRNRFEGKWQTAYRARVRLARKYWTDAITNKEPALALCLAIEKLIDSEVASAVSGQ